jgi:asparagine synthase (glutamine-hydrolysing)
MVVAIGSNHRYLECKNENLLEALYQAVRAKDLPGMADVDSSMLYFAGKIKENHTVCLSGECADEIFGGYPWFRDEEVYKKPVFPWSKGLTLRKEVLNPNLLKRLPLEEYVRCQYEKTMRRVPLTGEETPLLKRQKEISYLNIEWFMATLLERKDRMTMAAGLEVRVPFADHRLISYLYKVPWEYKYHNREVKGLLKDVATTMLPKEVIWRKKCPYPKTYDPRYERALKEELTRLLHKKEEPIGWLLNKKRVLELLGKPSDYGRPWFGQLMAAPQMYAYFIQINTWLNEYKVDCHKLCI